jgi:O-antigen chain-terminating methyltransferase
MIEYKPSPTVDTISKNLTAAINNEQIRQQYHSVSHNGANAPRLGKLTNKTSPEPEQAFKHELLSHRNPITIKHINELLGYHDKIFVEVCYLALLSRQVDSAALTHYQNQLRNGQINKEGVIARLLLSPEGRKSRKVGKVKFPAGGTKLIARFLLGELPFFGYFFKWLLALVKLPSFIQNQVTFQNYTMGMIRDVISDESETRKNNFATQQQLRKDMGELDYLKGLHYDSVGFIEDLRLSNNLATYTAFEDFYLQLENRFRAPKEEVTKHLQRYSSQVSTLLNDSRITNPTALDLGCGRGEWLSFVAAHGFTATGIDSNPAMVESSEQNDLQGGYKVIRSDLLTYIQSLPDNSVSLVSAFHVAEHLPSGYLLNMLQHIYRILEPGGAVLLETPNPDNLIVGAKTFYIDPTHQKPLPAELLQFMLDYHGFLSVEVITSNRSHNCLANTSGNEDIGRIDHFLFGEQDYAVWGRK